MGYQLNRIEGELVKTREIKLPRTDVVIKAELRRHVLTPDEVSPIVWYDNGSEWKIFVCGEAAERFMK